MENKNVHKLEKSLEERKEMINGGIMLMRETKGLFDTYGKDVFTSAYDRFAELEKSLNAKELRMVVIGEFSRGKSSLLNALLGIRQLPTATEATTAINTFIYGLETGENTPYLNIVYLNGHTQRIDIVDDGQQALREWGTELEADKRDARKEVDHIELHMHHRLLDLGLVLIDTPGLESMQKHHEEITHRAIDSAHIAIWVQAATQLGGNKREWEFLKDTIRKSFRKFITVINWWDKVLEPDDEQDKKEIKGILVKKKIGIVRDRFKEALHDLPRERLDMLTNDDNLFGVSARWALSGTEEQKMSSGIDKLAERINAMCMSNEAMDEIFFKPMQQLSELQSRLKIHLDDTLAALDNTESFEKQRQDIERLQMDIQAVEMELKNINMEAQVEHQRLKDVSIDDIKKELIEPLIDLKNVIDKHVTPDYVRRQIEKRSGSIGLPENLRTDYEKAISTINDKMASQRQTLMERLEQLRLNYSEAMSKYMGEMSSSFAALNIELPKMNISCNLDFTALENFYSEKIEIEKKMEACRGELIKLEEDIARNTGNDIAIKAAKEEVERMERLLIAHGSAPSPIVQTRHVKVSDGGIYNEPEYRTVDDVDYSNVKDWHKTREGYEHMLKDSEKHLQQIIDAERAKSGKRLTLEQAMRRRQRELDKMETQVEEQQRKMEKAETNMVQEAHASLLRGTSGQLDKYISLLQRNAAEGVSAIFANHLKYLQECVNNQYTEKLKGKESNKRAALEVLQQGEDEIAQRKAEIADALSRLAQLQADTRQYLCGGE